MFALCAPGTLSLGLRPPAAAVSSSSSSFRPTAATLSRRQLTSSTTALFAAASGLRLSVNGTSSAGYSDALRFEGDEAAVAVVASPATSATTTSTSTSSSTSGSGSGSSLGSATLPITEPHAIYPAASRRTKDAWWEKIFIFFLSWGLAAVSTDQVKAMKFVRAGMGYAQFVAVTRTLLRGTVDEIKQRILGLLLRVIPRPVRRAITVFSTRRPRFISEKSSMFMSFGGLGWLVGPTERFHVDVTVPAAFAADTGSDVLPATTTEKWLSGVKLVECRYLVESGCKSACLHLCKGPTQALFNDELGMKLYMKPNFRDCSCEMFFGVSPPPMEQDDVYGQPCFSTCSMTDLLALQRSELKQLRAVAAAAAAAGGEGTGAEAPTARAEENGSAATSSLEAGQFIKCS